MTKVMERTCTARRHASTDRAWQAGCRCRGAKQAHAAALERQRGNCTGPAVDASGRCIAERHGNTYAYKVYGCRCPETVAVKAATQRKHYQAKTRVWIDPRNRWRGPDMAVDRLTLQMAVAGERFVGTLTTGELIAAVSVLRRMPRLVGDMPRGRVLSWSHRRSAVPVCRPSTWFVERELNGAGDIARILGLTAKQVWNVDQTIIRLRVGRASRRAADAAYRARRNAGLK